MISREQRTLFIVNCLAEHGDRRLKKLYRFIEHAGIDVAKRFLGSHYSELSVLRDADATWPDFLNSIDKLSRNQNFKAIDLFFQLHGKPEKVRFFDRWIPVNQMGQEIGRITNPGRLRLVYNLCCYGDSHSVSFLSAGFKTSIGALKINANAALEYPSFCRLWARTGFESDPLLNISEVLRRSDRPTARNFQDFLAKRYFEDVDSRKIIRGNKVIKISDKSI